MARVSLGNWFETFTTRNQGVLCPSPMNRQAPFCMQNLVLQIFFQDQDSLYDGITLKKDLWWSYLFRSTCKQSKDMLVKSSHPHFPMRSQLISTVLLIPKLPTDFGEHIESQVFKQSFEFPLLFDPHQNLLKRESILLHVAIERATVCIAYEAIDWPT